MLRDRHVLAAVAARFISRTGGEAAFFVGIWGKAAFTFQATPGELAVVMAALGVTSLAGSALAGMLIDRHGPRRVLMVSELAFAPATIAAAFSSNLTELAAASAAIGLFGAPAFTAIASLGPFLTDDDDRLARINSWLETAGMAALISGTAGGALLAANVSIDSIFWFDAATSIVAAALVWPIQTRRLAHEGEHGRSSLSEVRAGFSYVYTHRRLRFYVLMATSVWLLFGLYGALEPLFYRDVLGTGPEAIGVVNTVLGIGLVVGTIGVGRLPGGFRTATTTVLLLVGSGLAAIGYVATSSFTVVVVAAAWWGLTLGGFLPLVRTLIQINAEEQVMGRVMGTTQVHGEAAKLLPLLIAPAMAAMLGVQLALLAASAVLTAVASAMLRTARRLDRTRDVAVPPPGTPDREHLHETARSSTP